MWLCGRDEIVACLSSCIKLNCKTFKNQNIRTDALNLIDAKVGNASELTGIDFLNRTLVSQSLRTTIDK